MYIIHSKSYIGVHFLLHEVNHIYGCGIETKITNVTCCMLHVSMVAEINKLCVTHLCSSLNYTVQDLVIIST
jgi:hypothetical protein